MCRLKKPKRVKITEVNRGEETYTISAFNGYIYAMIRSYLRIASNEIILTNAEDLEVKERETSKLDGKAKEVLYEVSPSIIVFHTLYGMSFEEKVKLFQEKYAEKLNGKYAVGRFCYIGGKYPGDKEYYINPETAFCVALFDKTKEEILDFTFDFIEETGSRGAMLDGWQFSACVVYINKNNYYA